MVRPAALGRACLWLAAPLLLVACGSGDRPDAGPRAGASEANPTEGIVVVDDAGRFVRLDRPARRVASLVPSVTETIAALGAVDRLVARTRYDRDPTLAHLPSLGGGLDPSLETLLALEPDLVVAWNAREDRGLRVLPDRGLPVYRAEIQDTTAMFATIRRVGVLLDLPSAADSLAAALRDSLGAVAAESRAGPRPSVFYLISGSPPRTAGPGTFIAQAIGLAGGRIPFAEIGESWPSVSLEAVIARQPDVIVVPTGPGLPGAAELAERPGWRRLAAVRAGRIVEVPADLFARPGPSLPAAVRALRGAIEGVLADRHARAEEPGA